MDKISSCKARHNLVYQLNKGFTLIELLVVLAIVAILVAVGYPTYTAQVRETNRNIAVGEMLDLAAHLERVKAQRFSFPVQDETVKTIEGRYNINLESTVSTYTITGEPVGAQIGDKCGTLSYDNESTWTVSTGELVEDCVRH